MLPTCLGMRDQPIQNIQLFSDATRATCMLSDLKVLVHPTHQLRTFIGQNIPNNRGDIYFSSSYYITVIVSIQSAKQFSHNY